MQIYDYFCSIKHVKVAIHKSTIHPNKKESNNPSHFHKQAKPLREIDFHFHNVQHHDSLTILKIRKIDGTFSTTFLYLICITSFNLEKKS